MRRVGVRALKEQLSAYLRRAGEGERIVVTVRGEPLAALMPLEESEDTRWGWELVRRKTARWSGGKPRGGSKPEAPKAARTTSEMVLEGRR